MIKFAINWGNMSYIWTEAAFQVDRLEDELMGEQEKFKAISEELEQTFAEMSGYWLLLTY